MTNSIVYDKLCECGCGTTFKWKHAGQRFNPACRKVRDRKKAAASRRHGTLVGQASLVAVQRMVKGMDRVLAPVQLQHVPVEKLEGAIRKIIWDQS